LFWVDSRRAEFRGEMKISAKMKKGSLSSRQVRILGALLFATLVAGCYESGWGGGGSGYYGSPAYYGSPGYYASPGYGNTYYSKNVYRGYGSYPQPGLFGGYAPAHEAWDDSSRGRTSYEGERHDGGEDGEHRGAKSTGHGAGQSSGHGGTGGGVRHEDGQGH